MQYFESVGDKTINLSFVLLNEEVMHFFAFI